MKRTATLFLIALLVGGFWASNAHAHASYGGDCTQCHSFSNKPPVANAGLDRTVVAATRVTLSGTASRDPDDGIASYAWTQTAGTAVTLANANTVTATFTAPNVTASTVLTFRLTVTDRRPQSVTDTVNVTVTPAPANRPPVANAGSDQTISGGVEVTLNGTGSSDPDGGTISYAWTQTEGTAVTLTNATASTATFTAPIVTAQTTLTFQLTVRDPGNLSSTDTCVVTVTADPPPENQPPTANAGDDQTVTTGVKVTLSGAGSTDPENGIASYAWSQAQGPAVTLSSASAVNPTFTAPSVTAPTALTFSLTVTDNGGLSATDTCVVTVQPSNGSNVPPVANAGLDMMVLPGTFNNLSGFYSTDSDGSTLSYAWTQTGGPPVVLSDPTAMDPVFQAPLTPTTLTFQLVVTDASGLQNSGTVTVVVLPQ